MTRTPSFHRRSSKRSLLCDIALLVLTSGSAIAQTVSTWTAANPADGVSFLPWNSTTAWSTAPVFPHNGQPAAGNTYRAVIGRVAGQAAGPRVNLNRNVTLSRFDVSDGRIRSIAVATPFYQITVNGPFNWTGGMLDGNCVTTVSGGITIGLLAGAQPTNLSEHLLTNAAGQTATHAAGTLQFADSGVTLQDGGIFQNNGTFQVAGGVGMDDLGTSTDLENKFINAGTFVSAPGAAVTYPAEVFFENTGTVNVNNGTLELGRGGAATGGTFNTAAGAVLRFRGPHAFSAATAFTGAGTVELGAATALVGGLPETYDFPGGWNCATPVLMRRGVLTLGGNATVGAFTRTDGNIHLPAGGMLTANGMLALDDGEFVGNGGRVVAAGGLRILGGAFARLDNCELTNPAGQIARWEFSGGLQMRNGSRFVNAGTMELTGTGAITSSGSASGLSVINSGTIRRTTATGSISISPPVTNSGTISVETGTLQLSALAAPALTSTGGIHTVAAGATLHLTGDSSFDAASSFSGAGTMLFSTGAAAINCPYNMPGLTRVTLADVTFTTPATIGTYEQESGVADLEGEVVFQKPASITSLSFGKGFLTFDDTASIGGLTLTSGNFDSRILFNKSSTLTTPCTLQGNSLHIAAGQTLSFQSLFTFVSGTLSGGGTIAVPGGLTFGNGSETLDNVSLLIPAGATATHGGGSSLDCAFRNSSTIDNRGTFLAQNTYTLFRSTSGDNSRFLNSGTFTRNTSTGTYTVQLPFQNTGTVNVTTGRLTVTASAAFTQTAGTFRLNGGAVTKAGTAMIFQGGSLTGAGTITGSVDMLGGILAPGDGAPGTLTISSNLTLGAGATLAVDIGGTAQGTGHDFVSEAGTTALTLAGNLSVSFTNGFQNSITPAQTFTVLTSSANLLGAFANVASGARLNTADGFGSFIVTWAGTKNVVLSSFIANPVAPPPGRITGFSLTANDVTLTWAPFGNQTTYQVQTSTTMAADSWSPLGALVTGGGTTATVTRPTGDPRRYFRIISQ